MAKEIFVTGAPLGLFEHKLWINFFEKLRPSFTLPSRKLISTTLLEKEYEFMGKEISTMLNEATNLHLQCDGWSNCRNESIINFIISHPTSFFVKFVEAKGESHTADYIFKQMD